jgi:adenylosuccinate synthase
MEIKVVIGALFGDEGKGTLVKQLCLNAITEGKKPLVIRYSGGSQAAHTVVTNEHQHVSSSFGSGVLIGVDTAYVGNSFFDPICADREAYELTMNDVELPKIHMFNTNIVTPYDVEANYKDSDADKDGSCKSGLWPSVQRNRTKYAVRSNMLYKNDGTVDEEQCKTILSEVRDGYYKYNKNDLFEDLFVKGLKRDYLVEHKDFDEFKSFILSHDVLIFESTQGLLLDAERGFYPHVTSTNVGIHPLIIGNQEYAPCIQTYTDCKDFSEIEFYFIVRTYLTRHGKGYVPANSLKWDMTNKFETNQYNENQGYFKTGIHERGLFLQAVDRHQLDNLQVKYNLNYNLAISHMDLAFENGFVEMDNGSFIEKVVVEDNKPDNVVSMIASAFRNLKFSNYYYSDSPFGQFKKIN